MIMMSSLGFIPDIAILLATFILIVIYRQKISRLFTRLPFPNFLIYLISSLPFMIFEENINCLQTGCTLIPWTIPYLIAFVIILGLVVKIFKPKKILYPLFGFMIFGIFWEIIVGGLKNQMGVMGPIFYAFMIIWVGLSYAYIVFVPLIILIKQKS